MPTVTYVSHSGAEHVIDVASGTSLMQAAVDNWIDGIIGECGGCCSCATCHVMVDEDWLEKTGTPDKLERALLEAVPIPTPTSRLACQIMMSDELDGLTVRMPEEQF